MITNIFLNFPSSFFGLLDGYIYPDGLVGRYKFGHSNYKIKFIEK